MKSIRSKAMQFYIIQDTKQQYKMMTVFLTRYFTYQSVFYTHMNHKTCKTAFYTICNSLNGINIKLAVSILYTVHIHSTNTRGPLTKTQNERLLCVPHAFPKLTVPKQQQANETK